MISLHRSGTEGTALTLADRQIEAYKSLPYDSIQLASSTIPSGTDPYVTAHSSDATIPSSSGQITGGTPASSCTTSTQAVVGCATQTWTGPDGQPYRVDTYIVSYDPDRGSGHQAGNGHRASDDQRLAGLQDLEPRHVRVRSVEPAAITALYLALERPVGSASRYSSRAPDDDTSRLVSAPWLIKGEDLRAGGSDNLAGRTVRSCRNC